MSDTTNNNISGFSLFGETAQQKREKEDRKKIKDRKELDENLKDKPYDSITDADLGGKRTRRRRPRKSKKSRKSRKSRKHRK
jgi:hypothetical protein